MFYRIFDLKVKNISQETLNERWSQTFRFNDTHIRIKFKMLNKRLNTFKFYKGAVQN